jgi:Na+/H+-translocating membrane pyrophosphatase
VIAVLGYWVLLQAVKESAAWLKRSGYVLGGVLAVAGLLGLLCSVASHSRCSSSRSCLGPGMMPPGHPPIGDMAR